MKFLFSGAILSLNMTHKVNFALLSVIIIIMVITLSCKRTNTSTSIEPTADTLIINNLPDTLRVGTLYSPTSYFIYRETEMGYDYDLINRFASDKQIAIDLIIFHNLTHAIEQLDSGKIDLLAYEIPITAEYREHVVHCGVENITHQVLVQPKRSKKERITDVTQLVGREVYVEENSKYFHRLHNLNEELGGGIIIKPVKRDTLITEDLIAMVSNGEIPLTVVDSDIARINKTYYRDLDITMEISFPQRSAWGVSPRQIWLADSINEWAQQESPKRQRINLLKRYYEMSKQQQGIFKLDFSNGKMSPFDNLFKKHAAKINWDWRLLAAMGYTESRYDSTQVSWAGARGVMQLMPATARAFGLTDENITNNDKNIEAACKVIKSLESSLSKYVSEPIERKKFIIAAYNSGLAHIIDAIAIAKKLNYNSTQWHGMVAEALLLKAKPEFYNDPVCKYGYFRGRQTYEYVKSVMSVYESAQKQISQ